MAMAIPRHLAHAPIIEAIIDCRVKAPAGFQVDALQVLKTKGVKGYPKIDEMKGIEAEFRVEGNQLSQSAKQHGRVGLAFRSTGGENVAQFRIDGFTFSRLSPYTSWDEIFPEAFRLWKMYIEIVAPDFITRIAVRYINKLRIPLPLGDFSDYLCAPPVVPPELPRKVATFLTRIVIPESDFSADAAITQALERPDDPNSVTIILDIDVYRARQYEIDDEKTKLEFEELHQLKNKIFFGSITEKTAGLFE
jgi:uncharacterized protein (TIGR04255 family)